MKKTVKVKEKRNFKKEEENEKFFIRNSIFAQIKDNGQCFFFTFRVKK